MAFPIDGDLRKEIIAAVIRVPGVLGHEVKFMDTCSEWPSWSARPSHRS